MICDGYHKVIISVMIPNVFVYCLQLVQWNGVVVELTISNVGTIAVNRRRRTGLLKDLKIMLRTVNMSLNDVNDTQLDYRVSANSQFGHFYLI